MLTLFAMLTPYLNAIRDEGKTLVTHIGLVDDVGAELSGGSPAYARLALTWVDDGTGIMRPNADLTFNIPASTTVAGWRGYSALTAGTDFGGADLTPEVYAAQGEYILLAASSGIVHSSS